MRRYIAFPLLVAALAGCREKPRTNVQEIRAALPEAAAMPAEDWARAVGGAKFDSFENRNLTALLLSLAVRKAPADFEIQSADPASVAGALTRGVLVSVIHDEDIKAFTCDVQEAGDAAASVAGAQGALPLQATGTVSFEVPGIWKGSVEFSAEKRGGRWAITEFHLPESYLLLARAAGGAWESRSMCRSNHVVLAVDEGGGLYVIHDIDDIDETQLPGEWRKPIRRKVTQDELHSLLRKRAGKAPRDADGLPVISVEIRPDPRCRYEHVQNAMVKCMRTYIWRVSFSMGGRRLEANLPRDDGREVERPVFVHEEVEDIERPVFIHEEAEEALVDIPLVGTGVGCGVGAGCFGFRDGGARRREALRRGGSRISERAVDRALEWLWRQQERDGRWDGERKYEREDVGRNTDVGTTGLALLAFLGAGHTERHADPLKYRETVKKAVAFLIANQRADGSIGHGYEGGLGYHHAITGLALAEAYGMARIPRTGQAAQKAVDYSINIHQVEYGGWRYNPRQAADLSVTGWFVAQLKSALIAGLKVDGKGFQGAAAFLDTVTKSGAGHQGLGSYQPPRSYTPTMTAAGMLCRQLMGQKRENPLLQGGADYLFQNLPEWGPGTVNFYYWYYGTLVMFQMGGNEWKAWNAALKDVLAERQRRGPPKINGSWDAQGMWCGAGGGRAYATAMCCMCLEVYYRYLPLYQD